MKKFKEGVRYTATAITDGEFHAIYDQLIGLVDGKLEHFTDWQAEVQEELEAMYKEEGIEKTEEELYTEAWEDVIANIPVAYEGCKEVYAFRGIPPNSRTFDVYVNYECVYGKEM